MKFTAMKFDELNKQLLSNIEIKISGNIEKYANFEEEEKVG